MKYIVRRASVRGNVKPCEEAKQEHITYKDGNENVWMVEIETIEELMNFQQKYGDIIIGTSIIYDGHPDILIYDDYIE